ncbi:OLC1v1012071C1 [Oldenlandia corymbosa var. corymbosa]|uniref:OLC1v1012071C1 n=1 Tax=Oldenlandia corymbosa var. corymbosa TaxID=529605 RepID=A0AAV1DV94_OLDCO|nr:OLC1v1012071C1 [Oldenlandia corymbosa var. corymbosa]
MLGEALQFLYGLAAISLLHSWEDLLERLELRFGQFIGQTTVVYVWDVCDSDPELGNSFSKVVSPEIGFDDVHSKLDADSVSLVGIIEEPDDEMSLIDVVRVDFFVTGGTEKCHEDKTAVFGGNVVESNLNLSLLFGVEAVSESFVNSPTNVNVGCPITFDPGGNWEFKCQDGSEPVFSNVEGGMNVQCPFVKGSCLSFSVFDLGITKDIFYFDSIFADGSEDKVQPIDVKVPILFEKLSSGKPWVKGATGFRGGTECCLDVTVDSIVVNFITGIRLNLLDENPVEAGRASRLPVNQLWCKVWVEMATGFRGGTMLLEIEKWIQKSTCFNGGILTFESHRKHITSMEKSNFIWKIAWQEFFTGKVQQ